MIFRLPTISIAARGSRPEPRGAQLPIVPLCHRQASTLVPRFPSVGPRSTRVWKAPLNRRLAISSAVFTLLVMAGTGTLFIRTVIQRRHVAETTISMTGNASSPPSALPISDMRTVGSYRVASPFSVDRDTFVLVDKSSRFLTLYRKVRTVPVAIGKNAGDKQAVGDCRTPECMQDTLFPIKKKMHTSPGSQFGPRYLELSTSPWTGIALHGTNEPESIGRPSSHGCVRLYNSDVLWLYNQVQPGDNVLIRR